MRLFRPNLQKMQDKKDMAGLIKALTDKEDEVSITAAKALGAIGDKSSVQPLIASLKKSHLRLAATEALGRIGGNIPVEPLFELLSVGNVAVRIKAIKALGQIGDARVVNVLCKALKDDNFKVRSTAANTLQNIGLPDDPSTQVWYSMIKRDKSLVTSLGDAAIEPLIDGLKDSDADVNKFAAEALGQLGDARAVPLLIALLKDGDVRKAAAEVIAEFGATAVEPLISALNDEDMGVRAAAADTLGQIEDARALEPLIFALSDPKSKVCRAAAKALGHFKDARAVEAIRKHGEKTEIERFQQIRKLFYDDNNVSEVRKHLSLIHKKLDKGSVPERRQAADLLCYIPRVGDPDSIEYLMTALKKEKDPEILVTIIYALRGLVAYEALSILRKMLKDSKFSAIKESIKDAIDYLKEHKLDREWF